MDIHALRAKLPGKFADGEIRYLASGDDSDAFLCHGQYVIKVPKREKTFWAQRRECQLYDFLERQKLSFQTPRVLYRGDSYHILSFIDGHPLSYAQYGRLSAQEQDALARDEAAFLRELHGLLVDASEPFYAAAWQDKRRQYQQDYERVKAVLARESLLSGELESKIDRFYRQIFQTDALFQYTPCLTHNDFSAGNMVFRENRLWGVIDFGDFVIGDPDNDFLCILDNSTDDFGKEFGRRVLYYYGHRAPEIAEMKAELNDAYWPLQQILLGDEREDGMLIAKGARELQETGAPTWIKG